MRTYSTDVGPLIIARSQSIPGSFIITAVIPEPSTTAALIGLGAFALAFTRRRPRLV